MTYMIDGKRLSQYKRDGLLRLCQSVHEKLAGAVKYWDADRERLVLAEAQRDRAVSELDATVIDRDHYKKESVDNWLKLETALADLARRDGTIAAHARTILELRKKVSRWAIFENIWTAAFWLCIAASLGGWLLWLR